MEIKTALSQRLLFLCKQKDFSLVYLSVTSAVPLSTVKNILNGSFNPGIVTIKKLCDGLGITLGEFFSTKEFDSLDQEIK